MLFSSRAPSRERDGFLRKGKRFLFFPSRAMRACPHCTEKCVRQLAHICSEKSGRQLDRFCSSGRGSVRAATAGTVAPSHPLLTFGKLTIKLEMLCQFRKAKAVRCRDSSPFASLSPMVGKLTTKLELLCQNAKQGCRAAALLTIYV